VDFADDPNSQGSSRDQVCPHFDSDLCRSILKSLPAGLCVVDIQKIVQSVVKNIDDEDAKPVAHEQKDAGNKSAAPQEKPGAKD